MACPACLPARHNGCNETKYINTFRRYYYGANYIIMLAWPGSAFTKLFSNYS